jgi:excisionase family DNA binding protein
MATPPTTDLGIDPAGDDISFAARMRAEEEYWKGFDATFPPEDPHWAQARAWVQAESRAEMEWLRERENRGSARPRTTKETAQEKGPAAATAPKEFLSPVDVADILGFDRKIIYRALETGELPASKIRRRWKIRPSAVDHWVERCRHRPTPHEI